nr:front-end fatty acid desaturase group A [Spirobranchus lamarcki]
MGKGGQSTVTARRSAKRTEAITWAEVEQHAARDDKWLVIDDQVYDISNWQRKHPGGAKLLSHYAGQDATEPFTAFHNDLAAVRKYLKPMHLGAIEQTPETRADRIRRDFAQLRQNAEKQGFFKPSVTFFSLIVGHILMFELLAYVTLRVFGTGWIPYIASVLCYTIVQGQASWTQHDFGHLSVFKSTWMNQMIHEFLMSFTKGASSTWWNHMHYQHHAKPNIIGKDPDVRLESLFVLGDTMAKNVAKEETKMPYNHQHKYFFAVFPPLLFPVYFQIEVFRYTISRRKWFDLAITLMYYAKVLYLYTPMLGFWGTIAYMELVRVLESHWFVWVSQSNHIPMDIEPDSNKPWLELQLVATCNVEKSVFNDWFTGHLNFQIEHHLFPTMPRHNLYKIQPEVQALCAKHGVDYQIKPLYTAFKDIYLRLKESGKSWEEYKDAYHLQ